MEFEGGLEDEKGFVDKVEAAGVSQSVNRVDEPGRQRPGGWLE